jgi:predicted NBD/HSP70 family sugar kinase
VGASAEPIHLVVDVDGLDALRHLVVGLRAELRSHAANTGLPDATQAGNGEVAHAIEQFVANWRDGRERIEQKLERVAALLEVAVETYRDVDVSLGNAATGSAWAP